VPNINYREGAHSCQVKPRRCGALFPDSWDDSHWIFRSHSVLLVGWEHCPAGLLACLKGSRECKLRRNSVDAVNAVDVLDQSDLVAGRRALTGGDGG
jgi:hypothetical protein